MSPQHLQAQDAYHELLLAGRLAALSPYPWGVLHVEVATHAAKYELIRGTGPIDITHHGERLSIGAEPVVRPIPPAPERPQPQQPPGCEPTHRAPG